MKVKPAVALLQALRAMAESRGSGIAGIARAGGQERVKINVRALFKYHDEDTGYRLVEEVLASMGEEDYRILEAKGIRLIRAGEGIYIEVPVELLEDPGRITE